MAEMKRIKEIARTGKISHVRRNPKSEFKKI